MRPGIGDRLAVGVAGAQGRVARRSSIVLSILIKPLGVHAQYKPSLPIVSRGWSPSYGTFSRQALREGKGSGHLNTAMGCMKISFADGWEMIV